MSKFHYFWPEFAFPGRLEPSPNETYPWLAKLGWEKVGGWCRGKRAGDTVQGNRCEWPSDEELRPGSHFTRPLFTHFRFGSPSSLRPGRVALFIDCESIVKLRILAVCKQCFLYFYWCPRTDQAHTRLVVPSLSRRP